MKYFAKALVILSLAPLSFAQEEASLDDILEELRALRAQVSSLEERIVSLESKKATETISITALEEQESEEKRRWIDRIRRELKRADVQATGGWTKPENWNRISVGQKADEAIEILGEPAKRKFSLKKRTDEIFIYEGDLSGNGTLIEGTLRIYKGKITDVEAPQFPKTNS